MGNFIDHILADRRTLEQAVADLRARHARNPAPDLADMIRQGEAEILDRINEPQSIAAGSAAATVPYRPDRRKRR